MNEKDNVNNGFNDLLGNINKELSVKSGGKPSPKKEEVQKTSQKIQKPQTTDNGTRVFDTVKNEGAVKNPARKENMPKDESYVKVFGRSNNAANKSENTNNKKETVKDMKNESRSTGKMSGSTVVSGKNGTSRKTQSRRKKSGVFGGLTRFLVYIVFIIVVSVILSLAIINVGNDMFAFIKDSDAITVNVPEGASTKDVAKILGEKDVISYPFVFRMYTDFKKGRSSYYTDGYKAGEFEVSPDMNYDNLIYTLSNSTGTREVVRLTFPEGSTIDEIIDILIKGGVQNTKEEYIDVIQNYDFDYRFMPGENFPKGRKYRLEGYLFPDTYDFYTDASALAVIDKFLVNFNNKFDQSFYETAEKLGYTVDEIIRIASLVEKEARRTDDLGKVSSVFHNRLKNSSTYPYLQSDATIQYALPERKSSVTPEDLKYDTPYNTYLYAGLPPSAISNPGLDAITNALYPENTSYYYFVANSRGETLFAKTLEGHNANIAMIKKEKGN